MKRRPRKFLHHGPVRIPLFMIALLQIFTYALGRLVAWIARGSFRFLTRALVMRAPAVKIKATPMAIMPPRRISGDSTRRRRTLTGSRS